MGPGPSSCDEERPKYAAAARTRSGLAAEF
jgi:hypothetical protein